MFDKALAVAAALEGAYNTLGDLLGDLDPVARGEVIARLPERLRLPAIDLLKRVDYDRTVAARDTLLSSVGWDRVDDFLRAIDHGVARDFAEWLDRGAREVE